MLIKYYVLKSIHFSVVGKSTQLTFQYKCFPFQVPTTPEMFPIYGHFF